MFHPYNDDIFVSIMYRYSMDMLPPEPTPLMTRRVTSNRDCEEGLRRIVHDYFVDNCIYQPSDFKGRFRLRKNVFNG